MPAPALRGYSGGVRSIPIRSLIVTTVLLASCASTPVSKVDDARLAQRQIDDSRCDAEGRTYWSGAGGSPGQKGAATTLYEQCMRAQGWQPEPDKFED